MLETALGPIDEDEDDVVVSKSGRSSASSPMMDFGDYELLEEIGRGGQGVVYRARQKSLNRTVALKVIALGHFASTPHLRRFRQEAESAAKLDHPQIVPIYEIAERDGSCYFSMKLIEGGRLDELIKAGPMAPRRAAELLVRIARTVQFAHDHGIVHRDIKPGNILLDKKEEPHLTDFGLARLIEQQSTVTNSFDILGTPSYMAPEQAAGRAKELAPGADVYSLGAVFYHLLTGEPPFAGGTTYETIRMVLDREPRNPRHRNPNLDVDLATICLKCLQKEPEKRYPTAAALADDLERWMRCEPIRARPISAFGRVGKWIRRNPTTALLESGLVALGLTVGIMMWNNGEHRPPASGIAVLPFQNLSDADQGASLLADGMQDDILTKLAKIADLKVISRTSVNSYGGARNIRQIGRALNVSHVLEGSLRRSADKLHFNVQLIDTRTDAHVWAEAYDYKMDDVFAIQSEIALQVAKQLHVRISPAEKQLIEQLPTSDLTAYDLYTRAKNLFPSATNHNSGRQDMLEAADLLNRAVARDPSYFQAYCLLAGIHDALYLLAHDHDAHRLALADSAIAAARRLRPDAGETRLAEANHLYSGYLNYEAALSELELAQKTLPNDARVFELKGLIQNRRGKQPEAVPELQHAVELDPRSIHMLERLTGPYWSMRRYGEVEKIYDRILAIEPDNFTARTFRADADLAWKADTSAVHEVIDSIRATNPGAIREVADSWVLCALADRDPVAIKAALIAAGENTPLNDNAVHFSRSFVEGWIARLEKDEPRAQIAFESARAEQEKIAQAEPDYAPPLCVLGVIDAMLGRKEQALSECSRATELLPVEKDAFNGPMLLQCYAFSAAWVGEKDLALEQLDKAVRSPGWVSYGNLKLLPFWDPLRGDPRFEAIVASMAPK